MSNEHKTVEALSIVYPAVTDILSGHKRVEIRSWAPPRLPMRDLVLVENHCYLREDGQEDSDGLARARVDVVGVHPWTPEDAAARGKTWSPGYLCWELENIRAIEPALPCVARRGVYRVTLADG